MHLIGHNMVYVSRPHMLHIAVVKATLQSVNRDILRCILIVCYKTIKPQRLVILCFSVIAHMAFNAYLTTCLLLFNGNFQRFISI